MFDARKRNTAGGPKGRAGGSKAQKKSHKRKVYSIMKKNMKNLKKTVVAGLAAFMMLAESVTAFACTEAPHDEANCACAEGEHGDCILFDEQFVDMDGNITPVSGGSGRTICLKHRIVEGYFQTHVKNDTGGCTVKTYHSTQCVYCNTIWMGDLYAIDRFTTCPHNVK